MNTLVTAVSLKGYGEVHLYHESHGRLVRVVYRCNQCLTAYEVPIGSRACDFVCGHEIEHDHLIDEFRFTPAEAQGPSGFGTTVTVGTGAAAPSGPKGRQRGPLDKFGNSLTPKTSMSDLAALLHRFKMDELQFPPGKFYGVHGVTDDSSVEDKEMAKGSPDSLFKFLADWTGGEFKVEGYRERRYWHLGYNVEGKPKYLMFERDEAGSEGTLYYLGPDGETKKKLAVVEESDVEHNASGGELVVSHECFMAMQPLDVAAFVAAVRQYAVGASANEFARAWKIKFKDGESMQKFTEACPWVLKSP